MRILIAGGGSAGHVNPAISIAKEIKKHDSSVEILFIGSKKGIEKDLVPREGFDIEFIDVEGFKRPINLKAIKTLFVMMKGLAQTKRIIRKFKPQIAIGTGGFVSGPAIFMAHRYGCRIMIHEQNAYPGVTNRMLSRYADVCMVSFDANSELLSKAKKLVKTGNLIDESFCRSEGYKQNTGKKTIVIIGGSQGAMTINNTVVDMINNHMKKDEFELIFAPGKRHYSEVIDAVKNTDGCIHIQDYIYDRQTVYKNCDLMVARGGAITISEIMAMGKPSIIIPSPFVPDHAQEKNAEQIKDKGACEVIYDDKEFTGKKLYDSISGLLNDDGRRMEIAGKAYSLGIRDANDRVYKEYEEVKNEIMGIGK